MTAYKITHTCGHTVEHHFTGRDDDSLAAWFSSTECAKCFYAKQEAKLAASIVLTKKLLEEIK